MKREMRTTRKICVCAASGEVFCLHSTAEARATRTIKRIRPTGTETVSKTMVSSEMFPPNLWPPTRTKNTKEDTRPNNMENLLPIKQKENVKGATANSSSTFSLYHLPPSPSCDLAPQKLLLLPVWCSLPPCCMLPT